MRVKQLTMMSIHLYGGIVNKYVLICVVFLWTSSAYAQWVNEPSGFQTTLDCPFNVKPTPSRDPAGCGIENVYNAGSITQDSSAPVSPPNLFKSAISAGNSTGGSQLNWVAPQIYNEMYVGLMWRTNPQFVGRQVGNKLFFVRGPAVNGAFLMNGGPGGPWTMIFSHNTGSLDNSHTCQSDLGLGCPSNVGPGSLTTGVWTKLEVYIKKSTTSTSRDGILRWWVNGVPAGNYTNMNYAPNGLNEWVWSETWDGTVNPVPSVDWSHYIDHLHISIPNGGGGLDSPPGPPATPTLRSITVP